MRMSPSPVPHGSVSALANPVRHLCLLASERQSELVGRLIAARAFAGRERYGLFLNVRYRIAAEQSGLYGHPMRAALFPDLDGDLRLREIERDLADLHRSIPCFDTIMHSGTAPASLAAFCGFLLVAEGMRLMQPWFRRQAEKLGLDATFGARNLDCDPARVRARWSGFVARMNAIPFSPQDLPAIAEAAREAMDRIHVAIDEEMGCGPVFRGGRRALDG